MNGMTNNGRAEDGARIADKFIPTRQSLLSRLKDWDDQDSWRDFFNTYWRLIYGAAVRAGLSEAEAQEVVQETVITVAKKMQGFKYEPASGSFKGWLLTITRWRIADQFRKRTPLCDADPIEVEQSDRTAAIERVADPASGQWEAHWDEEWTRNISQVASERVKDRVAPELYQIFDCLMTKRWSPRKVAQQLRVRLAQVYYAKYKVGTLIRKEVRRLEKQMF